MSLAQSSDPMSRTPSTATSSNIPDLVKIGSVPTNTAIDVETSILEPVSFSQSQCHFVLANKGILHSNSRITFSTSGDYGPMAADGDYAMFPAGVGVHSLIQRCRLAVGGKTVSEIEDFAHWMAYESSFVPNETNLEREQVLNSRLINLSPDLTERSPAAAEKYISAATLANNKESVKEAVTISLDNGRDFNYANRILTGGICPPDKDTILVAQRNPYDFQQDKNKPIFSILLADLFPFLKMNQLPLFMMKEQVSVTLTFTPVATPKGTQLNPVAINSKRLVVESEVDAALVTSDVSIDRDNVKMIADYIYYPQELMSQYAEANRNMGFTYVDYQFVKRTVVQDGAAVPPIDEFAAQLIQNLGGAGRIVNKVVIQTQTSGASPSLAVGQQALNLLGDYESSGPAVSATTAGTVTTNLRYNDLFLFPIDVTNSARHFHNLQAAEGKMPFVSRDLYSGQGQLTTKGLAVGGVDGPFFAGYGGNESIRSKFFHTAYRLNRNERVNSRGIELYDRRTTMEKTSTLRCWLQVVRTAQLQDGILTVEYA
tara:strand:+ start:312 stop:1940 length:1629 start_codon:yes stop_codon:yes gene_type:complete